jgi:hypothetical protein
MNSTASIAPRDFSPNPVIPFPQSAPNEITQSQLEEIVALRRAAREAKADVEAKDAELLALLRAGATIEPGIRTAAVATDSRRNVSWKSVAMRLAGRLGFDGAPYCLKVSKATKPNITFSLKVE